jgi:hypothetical protein
VIRNLYSVSVVSVTRGIFVLCHHIIVNLFVRKPELNGANLPNFDLNSCHFCPSFFCPPTVHNLTLTYYIRILYDEDERQDRRIEWRGGSIKSRITNANSRTIVGKEPFSRFS